MPRLLREVREIGSAGSAKPRIPDWDVDAGRSQGTDGSRFLRSRLLGNKPRLETVCLRFAYDSLWMQDVHPELSSRLRMGRRTTLVERTSR